MKMSHQGLTYLAEWEGLSLEPYDDGFGYLTIGVGHLVQPHEANELSEPITPARAYELLSDDVRDAEDAINRFVEVPLEQHQFDALCCWTFNIGITAMRQSTLVRELNTGDYEAPVRELPRWNKVRGQTVRGLVNRRRDTVELWSEGDYQRDH